MMLGSQTGDDVIRGSDGNQWETLQKIEGLDVGPREPPGGESREPSELE